MPATTPIRFSPDLEHPAPDEAAVNAELVKTLRGIIATTSAHYGHAVRGVHAKSHAILEGEMVVGELPPELAQGAFARPGTFPVVMRLSTNPGDILDDGVSAPRGLAVKVIGVEGERLPGSEGDVTQDFVMANAPAFAAPDAAAFLKTLKVLAATTDRGEGAKMVLSTALRGVGAALKAVGIESGTVASLGGQPFTHPLGETFYSQTPLRWGDHVGKVSVAPVSTNLVALVDRPIRRDGNPNALRQAAIDAMGEAGGEWEVRVQLCTDLDAMPIEDASVQWPEEASPYRAVARIRVPAQPAWNESRAARADDRLSFAPWHGLRAHEPLGSINRARRPAYAETAQDRAARNGDTITEPTEAVRLSTGPASAQGTTPGREGFRNARPRTQHPGRSRDAARGTRALAGAAGGLAAGLAVTAILVAKQLWTRQDSDFLRMQRRLDGRSAWQAVAAETDARAYAGHLAISAATGAAYGVLAPAAANPVTAGLTFGLGLGAAHGIGQAAAAEGGVAGALSHWRDQGPETWQHLALNALFGVTTALVTRRLLRRR